MSTRTREGRRYVVTTVVRGAPVSAVSGRVYVVDAEQGRILGSAPMPETPWRQLGTNPRGGHRGGRGIALAGGRLALANADEVHVVDRSWQTLAVLSDRLIGDIHELAPAEDGLWVCSTRADSLVHLGWDGIVRSSWSWRDNPDLVKAFGYRSVRPIDRAIDYRDMSQVDASSIVISHPNGVLPHENGLLVSLGRVRFPSPSRRERMAAAIGSTAQAAIVGRTHAKKLRAKRVRRYGADPQPGTNRRGIILFLRSGRPAEVLVNRRLLEWPNHNVAMHRRELVFCDTSSARVVALHRDSGKERFVHLPKAGDFVRGLAWLDGDRFIVGSRRRGALHTVDLETGRAESLLELSDEYHEAVHDIAPLPEEWDDLPSSLGR